MTGRSSAPMWEDPDRPRLRIVVGERFAQSDDPKGGYGIGIIGLENTADLETVRANDPTLKANQGFRFEALPMLRLVTRP